MVNEGRCWFWVAASGLWHNHGLRKKDMATMTEQGSTRGNGARSYRAARTERRRPQSLQPPPYRTAEGLVDIDRRSYIDRRSAWIRDYRLHGDDSDTH